MLFTVYFSHGYREREIVFNEYFGILFEESGLRPSIDPPSDDVNTAKLEKHLQFTSGLIAVLSRREGGVVSPYILYEIKMCLKLGKPALVFVEDCLPEDVVPPYILQKRFSTKSFSRQVYEHLYAIDTFKRYLGRVPVPKYQVISQQKSCILIGSYLLDNELVSEVKLDLRSRGYNVTVQDENEVLPLGNLAHFKLLHYDLVIIVSSSGDPVLNYYYGAINSYQIPSIVLSVDDFYMFSDEIPTEFQPKKLMDNDQEHNKNVILNQVSLYEEDFVVLGDEDKVRDYVKELASAFDMKGNYTRDLRSRIVNTIVSGDNYSDIVKSSIKSRSDNKI